MHVNRQAFDQFRRDVTRNGRALRDHDIVPIQAAIETSLGRFPDLLVEKIRRQPHPDAVLEITTRWLGLGAETADILRTVRNEWSDDVLSAESARFYVSEHDVGVLLSFAAAYPDDRYLTGRVKVTF